MSKPRRSASSQASRISAYEPPIWAILIPKRNGLAGTGTSFTRRSRHCSARAPLLYNHFAGKFFGHENDQDLAAFARDAARGRWFKGARILSKRDRVRFFVDDFRALMSVVWMILLYPNVHRYSAAQRREITEHVYRRLFARRKPCSRTRTTS